MKSDQITALAALIPVLVAGFTTLWRELRKVRSLVNGQLEEVKSKLDTALVDNVNKDAQIAHQKKIQGS